MKKDQNKTPLTILLDNLELGVFRIDMRKKPKFVFVNRSFCDQLKYYGDEMASMNPEKIFVSQKTYQGVIRQLQKTGVIKKKETVLINQRGDKFCALLSLFAETGPRGKLLFIEGSMESFDAQQQMRKDLADSKELFKVVFNNSAVAIIVADKQGRVIAWNPFTEKMLKMDWEDLFNRHVSDFYLSKKWRTIEPLYFSKKTKSSDIDTKIVRKDGTEMDVNLSLALIKDASGKVNGSIGILRDISAQKKTHKMLVEAKKSAEAASDAKTMFLANMSHEVRTPMNTILGMVGLTLDTELTPEQRDNLLTVKNAADILLSLLNDILDLSRVEAGKIQLEHIELKVAHLVGSVCKTMDILAKNKGLRLEWEIAPEVPAIVKGDPVRIRQILVNLINNAVKFTSEGKIRVDVKVEKAEKDSCVLIFSVADQGIGIDEDKQTKIFDVFTQEDASTTRQFGGTGLGLAICKKLLELMKGEIWVESKKGKGSTFFFRVPYQIVKQEDVPEALQGENIEAQLMAQLSKKHSFYQDAGQENAGPQGDVSILLAEDNLVNQKMTQRILEKKGWKVIVANDGKEVLDKMQEGPFDLILMDVQMPVMDGLESTRRIREKEKDSGTHIPIIALTARAMEGDRQEFLDSGMDDYISKPIDREKMFETIESFLNN